ncbi:protein of unknown function [Bacillus velezensis UCMB5113]|nr:protein of unknown function [Bacillus velezensis UCMB5113]
MIRNQVSMRLSMIYGKSFLIGQSQFQMVEWNDEYLNYL